MPILTWLHRHVFNSVPLGIAILVSIALYVAVGSGMVGVREWLEMDEMLFFNWWPMKVLAILLIVNLSVVTVSRIPLTVPRYGVWCIHMGIILLVLSLSAYYSQKVEGLRPARQGADGQRLLRSLGAVAVRPHPVQHDEGRAAPRPAAIRCL